MLLYAYATVTSASAEAADAYLNTGAEIGRKKVKKPLNFHI